jgi:hypothetical protein
MNLVSSLDNRYFAYDHKYDEFAVRIAEGGIVPRRTKKKPVKSSSKQAVSMMESSDKEADIQETGLVEEAGDGVGEDEDDTTPIEAMATAEVSLSALDCSRVLNKRRLLPRTSRKRNCKQ